MCLNNEISIFLNFLLCEIRTKVFEINDYCPKNFQTNMAHSTSDTDLKLAVLVNNLSAKIKVNSIVLIRRTCKELSIIGLN